MMYVYHVFDESTKSEVSQWNLNGIENFLSSFPNKNFDVDLSKLGQN
jgi:hypothetical protein